jgi:hypothetical protein
MMGLIAAEVLVSSLYLVCYVSSLYLDDRAQAGDGWCGLIHLKKELSSTLGKARSLSVIPS